MIGLDLRSIILMTGVMGLLLSVVLYFVRLSYPKSIQGIGYWALAPIVFFVAVLLFAGRGRIPDLVSVVGANLLLFSGISLLHFGTQRFFGLAPSYRLWIGICLATVPVLAWFTLVQPSFVARVLIILPIWCGMMLAMALLVWRHGPEIFSTRFTVVVLLLHASVIFLRFMSAWLPLPGEHLLDPSGVQTLYIVTNALMIFALAMGLFLMVSDRLREEAEHSASHDSLTNALTRRALIHACELELARCRRHGRNMALLMLDIDHFKVVNDIHGHQTGDRVLTDFITRITSLLRSADLLGRFGGEEFVVLLPETTLEQACMVAERIRLTVAMPAEGLPPITVSAGVTANCPEDVQVDVLLGRADRALYKAKAEGRNCVAVVGSSGLSTFHQKADAAHPLPLVGVEPERQ